jgi:osmotically inducible protein OsmC
MPAVRRADVVWEGDLMSGSGVVSAGSSGRFEKLPVSWGSRTEDPAGRSRQPSPAAKRRLGDWRSMPP